MIEGSAHAWIEEGVAHVPHSRDALTRAKVAREDWLLVIRDWGGWVLSEATSERSPLPKY